MTSDKQPTPNSRLAGCDAQVAQAIAALITCYEREGKLLVCGNGGSAADAEHIVGEMMKGFCLPRRLSDTDKAELASVAGDDAELLGTKLQYGLAALSLVSHSALITATANDQDGKLIFAQQVWGLGQAGDILLAISTSGNSKNVLLAAKTARAKNMLVIGLTGATGGKLAGLCDITINVPSDNVAQIQEMHLPIYHHICASVEAHFFA
jgi:D-sedoheptulose 7-phosphate isomerase